MSEEVEPKEEFALAMETKKIALSAVLIALGVVLAPFVWFPAGPTKCFPGQHIVNVVSAILLGPWYAVFIAMAIAVIRYSTGLGSIFAFPGSPFGALVVGIFHRYLLKMIGIDKRDVLAGLTEPLGTVVIGATLSALIFAPLIGSTATMAFFWVAFAISSIPGAIIGVIVVIALRRSGIVEELVD